MLAIISYQYVHMLRNFLEWKLSELENPNVWCQPDGVTAHTARIINGGCEETVSKAFDIVYTVTPSGHVHEISRFVICVWGRGEEGRLKVQVYKHRLRMIDEVKAAIRQKITEITLKIARRVKRSLINCLRVCITIEGHHLGHV